MSLLSEEIIKLRKEAEEIERNINYRNYETQMEKWENLKERVSKLYADPYNKSEIDYGGDAMNPYEFLVDMIKFEEEHNLWKSNPKYEQIIIDKVKETKNKEEADKVMYDYGISYEITDKIKAAYEDQCKGFETKILKGMGKAGKDIDKVIANIEERVDNFYREHSFDTLQDLEEVLKDLESLGKKVDKLKDYNNEIYTRLSDEINSMYSNARSNYTDKLDYQYRLDMEEIANSTEDQTPSRSEYKSPKQLKVYIENLESLKNKAIELNKKYHGEKQVVNDKYFEEAIRAIDVSINHIYSGISDKKREKYEQEIEKLNDEVDETYKGITDLEDVEAAKKHHNAVDEKIKKMKKKYPKVYFNEEYEKLVFASSTAYGLIKDAEQRIKNASFNKGIGERLFNCKSEKQFADIMAQALVYYNCTTVDDLRRTIGSGSDIFQAFDDHEVLNRKPAFSTIEDAAKKLNKKLEKKILTDEQKKAAQATIEKLTESQRQKDVIDLKQEMLYTKNLKEDKRKAEMEELLKLGRYSASLPFQR